MPGVLINENLYVCRLLVYLPSCLDQETAKVPLRSSSQAATCYCQSSYSKVESILFSALPKGYNKQICRPIFTLSLFNVKRQAGKLRIWSVSAWDSNPSLTTTRRTYCLNLI